jgi:two-component system response regulator DegU
MRCNPLFSFPAFAQESRRTNLITFKDRQNIRLILRDLGADRPDETMILIAEDNTDFRRMMRSLVEEIDADVIEAGDGCSAFEAFERHLPDWVLMDINMKPVDGLSAMREILERHPEARIIIVSHHQDAQTRATALAMGAHAFVGKEDLMSVRDLIRKK